MAKAYETFAKRPRLALYLLIHMVIFQKVGFLLV